MNLLFLPHLYVQQLELGLGSVVKNVEELRKFRTAVRKMVAVRPLWVHLKRVKIKTKRQLNPYDMDYKNESDKEKERAKQVGGCPSHNLEL
jgi:hypothetical protein